MSRPLGEIRPYRDGDMARLAANLRPADRAELVALVGEDRAQDVLMSCPQNSAMTWTHELNGEVLSVFGVAAADLLQGEGAIWLMGTRLLERHPSALMRQIPQYVTEMRRVFPKLMNAVDARNTRSIRWLTWLGFTILPARPMGVAGLPFHPFCMGY